MSAIMTSPPNYCTESNKQLRQAFTKFELSELCFLELCARV